VRAETDEQRLDRLLRVDPGSAGQQLQDMAPQPLLRTLRRLGRGHRAEAFGLLGDDRALRLLVGLDAADQADVVADLPSERAIALFRRLDPDDRARVLDHLPAAVSRLLLDRLTERDRAVTLRLAAFPARSAGRAMSPELASVRDSQSVGAALDHVREHGERAETVYMLPVLDDRARLVGVVSLRRLLFADPTAPVRTVMSAHPVSVSVGQDAEEAARLVRAAGLIAAPVVDSDERVVGVLTVDDAMRILAEAEDEDVARAGGSTPLRRSYRATSVLDLVRARIGWLLVLILAATLTVNVLDYFEATLSQAVTLALFVPLLIGTGGNAGAQSATTVVRAMAVGDVQHHDVPRVVTREVSAGAALGLMLAAVAIVPTTLFAGPGIAAVVCVSLVVICVLATLVGSLTPLGARRIGVDPAVVSAPLISTLVDASGLIIYFLVARAVLGLS
jgi:magnesium transporter